MKTDCVCLNKDCERWGDCDACHAHHAERPYPDACKRLELRPQVVDSFKTMWGNFPEPVLLILRNFEIVAANKTAEESGIKIGSKCSEMEPSERHRGCKANEARETREAAYHRTKMGEHDVYVFWLPVDGHPDYIIHFPVGLSGRY